jgi:hypothetical protein
MPHSHTIFVSDDAWHIASACDGELQTIAVPFGDAAMLEPRVEACRQALSAMGWAEQPVVLALASPWCLSASISTDGMDRAGRRRAMAFRMEENLPVSTEEVVFDYCESTGGHAIGVCGELTKLKAVVDAFEGRGIGVRHICPAALLSAADAAEQHGGLGGVLLGAVDDAESGVGYDLIELQDGKPARWWWLAGEEGAVRDRLKAWAGSLDRPAELALVGCNDRIRELAGQIAGVACVQTGAKGRCESAARHAARILSNAVSPWIDLRRDALAAPNRYAAYRRPLGMLAAAVVVLLVCISIVAQWRGRQYQSLSQADAQRQVQLFRSAMPNQHMPGNVRARLASEHRRLAGMGGQAGDDGELSTALPVSALVHLRQVLSILPTDVPYRILELNIQPDLIRIDGEAHTYSEAEGVAVALRKSTGYEIEPPKTQAIKGGGVNFVFTAKPRSEVTGQRKGD